MKLGERFDIRAFHDYVLSLGSVTLEILQNEIRAWIATREKFEPLPGKKT
jgi:uncharacterized protein (DUF885 family)